jgi:hypothetical protein
LKDIAAGLRDAADLAERAAVVRQYAELDGWRGDPAVIACLELIADTLRHAAAALTPPPLVSRRTAAESISGSVVWAISCAAFLLTVPNPAQPLVLAAGIAGVGVLSTLVVGAVGTIWDRRVAGRLAAAVNQPDDVRGTITELRIRVRALTDALEPDRYRAHLEVGRRIESVHVWIDGADHVLAEPPEST